MNQSEAINELHKVSLGIVDWRSDHGKRYKLSEILVVLTLALIAGAQDAEDIALFGKLNLAWFRKFLPMSSGAPAHDLYLGVLGVIKPDVVEQLVRDWVAGLRGPVALEMQGALVAFDGQTLRGSFDRASGKKGVHLLSAYSTRTGFVVGTVAVDEKSNEIPAMQEMLATMDVRGATVTADAMNCQKETAAAIRRGGADYVLQVKENQPHLAEDLKAVFADVARRRRPGEAAAAVDEYVEVDKGHGRIETRKIILSHDLKGVRHAADWADLAVVAAVLRMREDVISGKTSKEISYYLGSKGAASAKEFGEAVRGHWGIENGLHHSLDVIWGSDGHQLRDRTAAENLGRLRRFCAGLVKGVVGWGMSGKRVRKACGWNPDLLMQVLAGVPISAERTRRPNRKGAKDEIVSAKTKLRREQQAAAKAAAAVK